MQQYLADIGYREGLIGGIVASTVFVLDAVPAAQFGIHPTGLLAGVVCVGCLVASPFVAVAAAVSHLGFEAVTGQLQLVTLFEVAGLLLVGAVAHTVWDQFGLHSTETRIQARFGRQVGVFGAGVVVATATFAATVAWGYATLHLVPFAVLGPSLFLGSTLPAAVLGLAIFVLSWRTGNQPIGQSQSERTIVDGGEPSPTMRWWHGAIPLFWLIVGTLISAGYQSYQLVPATSFTVRDLGFIPVLADQFLFGPSGTRLQWVLGTIVFVTVIALVVRHQPARA
jgi:hypothetical protein